ncbi:MAG: hypothetical protein AMJ79_05715 [Phycisphaerae bacterium SM23_30]|nr:MAG: hypothetical protein AMJ79_05715 [Phycisphaerae bacterium SM23_30]
MSVKVKICGITNLSDAQLALHLGADYLGFNFYPLSPRYINPKAAGEIMAALPAQAIYVGVFVDAGLEGISEILRQCPLKIVQLHGAESNEECQAVAELKVEVIKALRMRRPQDICQAQQYNVTAILLDVFHEKLYGGTGRRFDWSWIRQVGSQKIFLAGGITPENITAALTVGTYGVDLCSGVEKEPGIKDSDKLNKLFKEIDRYYASNQKKRNK